MKAKTHQINRFTNAVLKQRHKHDVLSDLINVFSWQLWNYIAGRNLEKGSLAVVEDEIRLLAKKQSND